mgnify:CR=1 FL=1
MKDYYVTVCAACRCASCWHGEFFCGRARSTGTVDVLASVLAVENNEHRNHFSRRNVIRVCGAIREVERVK